MCGDYNDGVGCGCGCDCDYHGDGLMRNLVDYEDKRTVDV